MCGGIPGLEIKTTDLIVLSLGIELPVEDFFDPHYLVGDAREMRTAGS